VTYLSESLTVNISVMLIEVYNYNIKRNLLSYELLHDGCLSMKDSINILFYSFSDIENVDWPTIKRTLSSSDAWSICRIGDYFVKTDKNKRRHNQQKDRKEKMLKSIPTNNDEDEQSMIINGDSDSSTEDFDLLDDIYGTQPLFRIMPQVSENSRENVQPIIEPG
jgi:hypothetical protein